MDEVLQAKNDRSRAQATAKFVEKARQQLETNGPSELGIISEMHQQILKPGQQQGVSERLQNLLHNLTKEVMVHPATKSREAQFEEKRVGIEIQNARNLAIRCTYITIETDPTEMLEEEGGPVGKFQIFSMPFHNQSGRLFCYDIRELYEYCREHIARKNTDLQGKAVYKENVPWFLAFKDANQLKNTVPNPARKDFGEAEAGPKYFTLEVLHRIQHWYDSWHALRTMIDKGLITHTELDMLEPFMEDLVPDTETVEKDWGMKLGQAWDKFGSMMVSWIHTLSAYLWKIKMWNQVICFVLTVMVFVVAWRSWQDEHTDKFKEAVMSWVVQFALTQFLLRMRILFQYFAPITRWVGGQISYWFKWMVGKLLGKNYVKGLEMFWKDYSEYMITVGKVAVVTAAQKPVIMALFPNQDLGQVASLLRVSGRVSMLLWYDLDVVLGKGMELWAENEGGLWDFTSGMLTFTLWRAPSFFCILLKYMTWMFSSKKNARKRAETWNRRCRAVTAVLTLGRMAHYLTQNMLNLTQNFVEAAKYAASLPQTIGQPLPFEEGSLLFQDSEFLKWLGFFVGPTSCMHQAKDLREKLYRHSGTYDLEQAENARIKFNIHNAVIDAIFNGGCVDRDLIMKFDPSFLGEDAELFSRPLPITTASGMLSVMEVVENAQTYIQHEGTLLGEVTRGDKETLCFSFDFEAEAVYDYMKTRLNMLKGVQDQIKKGNLLFTSTQPYIVATALKEKLQQVLEGEKKLRFFNIFVNLYVPNLDGRTLFSMFSNNSKLLKIIYNNYKEVMGDVLQDIQVQEIPGGGARIVGTNDQSLVPTPSQIKEILKGTSLTTRVKYNNPSDSIVVTEQKNGKPHLTVGGSESTSTLTIRHDGQTLGDLKSQQLVYRIQEGFALLIPSQNKYYEVKTNGNTIMDVKEQSQEYFKRLVSNIHLFVKEDDKDTLILLSDLMTLLDENVQETKDRQEQVKHTQNVEALYDDITKSLLAWNEKEIEVHGGVLPSSELIYKIAHDSTQRLTPTERKGVKKGDVLVVVVEETPMPMVVEVISKNKNGQIKQVKQVGTTNTTFKPDKKTQFFKISDNAKIALTMDKLQVLNARQEYTKLGKKAYADLVMASEEVAEDSSLFLKVLGATGAALGGTLAWYMTHDPVTQRKRKLSYNKSATFEKFERLHHLILNRYNKMLGITDIQKIPSKYWKVDPFLIEYNQAPERYRLKALRQEHDFISERGNFFAQPLLDLFYR